MSQPSSSSSSSFTNQLESYLTRTNKPTAKSGSRSSKSSWNQNQIEDYLSNHSSSSNNNNNTISHHNHTNSSRSNSSNSNNMIDGTLVLDSKNAFSHNHHQHNNHSRNPDLKQFQQPTALPLNLPSPISHWTNQNLSSVMSQHADRTVNSASISFLEESILNNNHLSNKPSSTDVNSNKRQTLPIKSFDASIEGIQPYFEQQQQQPSQKHSTNHPSSSSTQQNRSQQFDEHQQSHLCYAKLDTFGEGSSNIQTHKHVQSSSEYDHHQQQQQSQQQHKQEQKESPPQLSAHIPNKQELSKHDGLIRTLISEITKAFNSQSTSTIQQQSQINVPIPTSSSDRAISLNLNSYNIDEFKPKTQYLKLRSPTNGLFSTTSQSHQNESISFPFDSNNNNNNYNIENYLPSKSSFSSRVLSLDAAAAATTTTITSQIPPSNRSQQQHQPGVSIHSEIPAVSIPQNASNQHSIQDLLTQLLTEVRGKNNSGGSISTERNRITGGAPSASATARIPTTHDLDFKRSKLSYVHLPPINIQLKNPLRMVRDVDCQTTMSMRNEFCLEAEGTSHLEFMNDAQLPNSGGYSMIPRQIFYQQQQQQQEQYDQLQPINQPQQRGVTQESQQVPFQFSSSQVELMNAKQPLKLTQSSRRSSVQNYNTLEQHSGYQFELESEVVPADSVQKKSSNVNNLHNQNSLPLFYASKQQQQQQQQPQLLSQQQQQNLSADAFHRVRPSSSQSHNGIGIHHQEQESIESLRFRRANQNNNNNNNNNNQHFQSQSAQSLPQQSKQQQFLQQQQLSFQQSSSLPSHAHPKPPVPNQSMTLIQSLQQQQQQRQRLQELEMKQRQLDEEYEQEALLGSRKQGGNSSYAIEDSMDMETIRRLERIPFPQIPLSRKDSLANSANNGILDNSAIQMMMIMGESSSNPNNAAAAAASGNLNIANSQGLSNTMHFSGHFYDHANPCNSLQQSITSSHQLVNSWNGIHSIQQQQQQQQNQLQANGPISFDPNRNTQQQYLQPHIMQTQKENNQQNQILSNMHRQSQQQQQMNQQEPRNSDQQDREIFYNQENDQERMENSNNHLIEQVEDNTNIDSNVKGVPLDWEEMNRKVTMIQSFFRYCWSYERDRFQDAMSRCWVTLLKRPSSSSHKPSQDMQSKHNNMFEQLQQIGDVPHNLSYPQLKNRKEFHNQNLEDDNKEGVDYRNAQILPGSMSNAEKLNHDKRKSQKQLQQRLLQQQQQQNQVDNEDDDDDLIQQNHELESSPELMLSPLQQQQAQLTHNSKDNQKSLPSMSQHQHQQQNRISSSLAMTSQQNNFADSKISYDLTTSPTSDQRMSLQFSKRYSNSITNNNNNNNNGNQPQQSGTYRSNQGRASREYPDQGTTHRSNLFHIQSQSDDFQESEAKSVGHSVTAMPGGVATTTTGTAQNLSNTAMQESQQLLKRQLEEQEIQSAMPLRSTMNSKKSFTPTQQYHQQRQLTILQQDVKASTKLERSSTSSACGKSIAENGQLNLTSLQSPQSKSTSFYQTSNRSVKSYSAAVNMPLIHVRDLQQVLDFAFNQAF